MKATGCGWLFAACLAFTAGLHAQGDLDGNFSTRPEIEKRLAAARSEISGLSVGADPNLRDRLQQLEAICQFHLAAVEIVAKAQDERGQAAKDLALARSL